MATHSTTQHTQIIKRLAEEHGFQYCGISRAEPLTKEARDLEKWLSKGLHGEMKYMENHFDKRVDPRKLVPGAKSVVSLMYNYYPKKELFQEGNLRISKYAYGKDYHNVIKKKMKAFMNDIHKKIGEISGRAFVDSAPVMDKAWAKKGGLGWIGKHTNLINKKKGSFFFISELIIDLELEPDGPVRDHCGTCTACLDACPTDALQKPYEIDGSKCISYYTIELKDAIPNDVSGKFENWIFGCDICQDVCPWNRFSTSHNETKFEPLKELGEMTKNDWLEITDEVFEKMFEGTAVRRTKLEGLKRNIQFVTNTEKSIE